MIMMSKVFGVISLALAASLWFVYNQWQGEVEQRIKAQAAHQQLKQVYEQQVRQLNTLNDRMMTIQSERDVAVNKLNGYRDRERILLERPESVERLANAATKRVFSDIKSASDFSHEDNSTETSAGPTH